MAYVLTFVIANTFLNIIAASQDTEKGYQTSGAANAVVFILTFRVYFVCGVKWVAPELKMFDFARFEADTQRGAPETFSLRSYYSV